jgi:hypothetical protein
MLLYENSSYLARVHVDEERVFISFIKAALQVIQLWTKGTFDKGVTNTRPCVSRLRGLETSVLLECHSV